MNTKMKKTRSWLLVLGFMLGIMPSCDFSYFDFEQINDYTYSPTFAIPIVNSSLSISDLLPDSDSDQIEVGEDNLISLVYRNRLSANAGGLLFQLPNAMFAAGFSDSPPGKSTVKTITRTFTFSTGHNDILDSLQFKRGVFELNASAMGLNADGYQATITATIPGSYNAMGQPFSIQVLANGGLATQSLEGYTIPFYSAGADHNQFDVHYTLEYSGQGNPANAPYTFNLNQEINDMRLNKMVGILAPRLVEMGNIGVEIKLFGSDFDGEVVLEDPRVHFRGFNSYGFNVDLTATQLQLSDGSTGINLTGFPVPWSIAGPSLSQIGQMVLTSAMLNRGNSNIYEGVLLDPENLYASFSALLNPGNNKAFVLDDSQLNLDVEVELPLFGTTSGFSLKDTIDLSRDEDIEDIEWIELVIDVVNELPLDVFLQLEFADSLNNVKMVLFEGVDDFNIVAAGQVDAQGNVISPERKYTRIMLDGGRTDAFLNSHKVFLSGRLNSTNEGQTPVKLYDFQTFNVRVGARIKAKINIEF